VRWLVHRRGVGDPRRPAPAGLGPLNRLLTGARLARARSGGRGASGLGPCATAGVRALASPPTGTGDVGEMDTGDNLRGKVHSAPEMGQGEGTPPGSPGGNKNF